MSPAVRFSIVALFAASAADKGRGGYARSAIALAAEGVAKGCDGAVGLLVDLVACEAVKARGQA